MQGSHGHVKSWKTMENEKMKSRPRKVMGNENLSKKQGEVMEFRIFIFYVFNILDFPIAFLLSKMC